MNSVSTTAAGGADDGADARGPPSIVILALWRRIGAWCFAVGRFGVVPMKSCAPKGR